MFLKSFQHKEMTVNLYAGNETNIIINIIIKNECQTEVLLNVTDLNEVFETLKNHIIGKYDEKAENIVDTISKCSKTVTMIRTSNGLDIIDMREFPIDEVEELYKKGWFLHYTYTQWNRNTREYKIESPIGKCYGYSNNSTLKNILEIISNNI